MPLIAHAAGAALLAALVPLDGVDAQNIVVNGGFEQGLLGWSSNAPAGVLLNPNAYEGAHFFPFASVSPANPDFAEQTLITLPGQSYQLTFFARSFTGSGSITSRWGGQPVLTLTSTTGNAWQRFDATVTASGASTLLRFEGYNVPSISGIDAVSVSAVPEPSTWALMGTGLLTLGGFAARRRSRAQS